MFQHVILIFKIPELFGRMFSEYVWSFTPVAAPGGKTEGTFPLPKTEKFAKDREQSTPQLAWESIVGKFAKFR